MSTLDAIKINFETYKRINLFWKLLRYMDINLVAPFLLLFILLIIAYQEIWYILYVGLVWGNRSSLNWNTLHKYKISYTLLISFQLLRVILSISVQLQSF